MSGIKILLKQASMGTITQIIDEHQNVYKIIPANQFGLYETSKPHEIYYCYLIGDDYAIVSSRANCKELKAKVIQPFYSHWEYMQALSVMAIMESKKSHVGLTKDEMREYRELTARSSLYCQEAAKKHP